MLEYINPNGLIHRTKDNRISIEKRLFPVDNNYSDSFDKWIDFFNKNIPLFNMFFSTQYADHFMDVKTSILIQCLEGYYRQFRSENIRFANETKKKLLQAIADKINESQDVDEICAIGGVSKKQLMSSAQGLLGRINEKSLWAIINESINHNDNTQLIFEYEKQNNLMKTFNKKIYSHRNFLAHLGQEKISFTGEENSLTQDKLELLLRVIVLSDIGLEIDKKSLTDCIKYVNTWYNENTLSLEDGNKD